MRKIRSLTGMLLCLSLLCSTVARASEPIEEGSKRVGTMVDDCVDFSLCHAHSEGLYADVTAEETREAFAGDYTMFLRKEATAEWVEYEIPQGQYLTFYTYFRQNEEISHFTFSWSEDGEIWQPVKPKTIIETVDPWKWIPVTYQVRGLGEEARFLRITYQNLNGVAWSPALAAVCSQYPSSEEDGFFDCKGTPYEEATTLLKKMGLVSGSDGGMIFRPEEPVTRAEFARLTAVGIKAVAEGESVFSDVDKSHWAASAVAGLYAQGILSGDERGMFHPEDTITAREATKIMVSALGYSVAAEEQGGYPYGYHKMALRLRLTDGMEAEEDEPIHRGEAAILLVNMLRAEMIYPTSFGENNHYASDGRTAMNYYHHVWEVEGKLMQVGALSAGSDQILKKNQAVIEDTLYTLEDTHATTLLGQKVRAYIRYEKEDGQGSLFHAAPAAGTRCVEVSALDYREARDGKIYVESQGEETQYAYDANTRVIYNGRYKTRMGLQENLSLSCGTMKIIFCDDRRVADVILVEEYQTLRVTAPSKLDGVLWDRRYGNVAVGLEAAEWIEVWKEGEKVEDPASLRVEAGDLVSLAKSHDGLVVKAEISRQECIGVLEEIRTEEGVCCIDGKQYPIAKYLTEDFPSGLLGKRVTGMLDINHALAFLEEDASVSGYGYLQATALGSAFSGDVWLRLMGADGNVKQYRADTGSRLNGEKVSADGWVDLLPQLVRYTVRTDGTLARLETAVNDGKVGRSGFTCNYQGDSTKYYGDRLRVFASVYRVDSNTRIFWIPKDSKEIDQYKVTDYTSLLHDKNYRVSLYDVREDYGCGAVVIDMAGSDERTLEYGDPVGVIQSAGNLLNGDGELCIVLSVLVNGQESKVYFDPQGGQDMTGGWIPNYQKRKTDQGQNPFSAGEVLQYYMDEESHCRAFRMLLTAEAMGEEREYEKNLGEYGALTEQTYFSELYTIHGKIKHLFADKIMVSAGDGFLRTIPLQDALCYRFQKGSGKWFAGDVSDLTVGSRVFVRMNFTATKEIIIIEE